jgi:hypothetical protein
MSRTVRVIASGPIWKRLATKAFNGGAPVYEHALKCCGAAVFDPVGRAGRKTRDLARADDSRLVGAQEDGCLARDGDEHLFRRVSVDRLISPGLKSEEDDSGGSAMVGSREDRGPVGGRKLLPAPDAYIEIEVLKFVLNGRAVEPASCADGIP